MKFSGSDMSGLCRPKAVPAAMPVFPLTLVRRLSFFLSLLLVLAVFQAVAAPPAAGGVPDEDALRASIKTEGFARVLVELKAPETTRLADTALSNRTVTPGRTFSPGQVKADRALSDYIHSVVSQVVSGLPAASYKVNRTYDFFPVMAMDVSGDALDALESSSRVSAIVEDRPVPLPPQEKGGVSSVIQTAFSAAPQVYPTNTDTIGAEAAWAMGYTGAGWYVAILDSGILTSHELFAGKKIIEACFSHRLDDKGNVQGTCPNGQSSMYGTGAARPFSNTYEGYDHGTHVAGIAAGNSGSVFGVAKDANIVAVQIFSPFTAAQCDGSFNEPCVMTWDSDQLAALNYILSVRGTYPIAAVNLSIGGDQYSTQAACDSSRDDPIMKDAIDKLRSAGIATVSVSGNDSSCDSLESPGCISSAIAVGAVNDSDQEAFFNDWQYSMLDLLAPGIQIYSATPDSPTSYEYLSGTSMAAPQVTGAWAILKQKDPSASVSDILYALESTGAPVHNSRCVGISGTSDINDYKPRIDVAAALSPSPIPVPSAQTQFDYTATASPVLNMSSLSYPVGVGPVAGTGSLADIVNVRVGLYRFSGPVDIYVGLYAPAADPDNLYMLTPGNDLKPFSTEGLIAWKKSVTGPIDESLFGELFDYQIPASEYDVYLLVTPPNRTDAFYLWSTSFLSN